MNVGELLALLKLDTSQFDGALKDTEGKASGWGSRLSGLMGGALVGAAALAAGAIIGIGAAGLSAADEAMQGVRNLQAELGVTETVAQQLGDEALELFKNGFTGSITEANSVIGETQRQLGGLVEAAQLGEIASGASAIADVFGADLNGVISAQKTLMEEFGLSAQQAQDLITTGFQGGLNASGDFLDTLTEYGPVMADGGLAAEEFFSILATGQQEGVLGTDKIADAWKEFNIRIQDGSTTTRDALAALGLDADSLYSQMSSGNLSVADAQQIALDALGQMKDPIAQNTAGVALFGSMWEDLGPKAILAANTTSASLATMGGATESLNTKYTGLGDVFEALKRRALVSLIPIGEKLLELANAVMPVIVAAFDWFDKNLPSMMEGARAVIDKVVGVITGLFGGNLNPAVTQVGSVFSTVWAQVKDIVGTSAAIIGTILGALAGFISSNQATIQAYFTNSWNAISGLITGVLGFIQGILKAVMSAIQGDWSGAWEHIKQACESLVLGMWAVIKGAFENGKLLLTVIGGAIVKVLTDKWQEAKTKVGELVDGLKSKVVETIDGLKKAVTDTAGGFVSAALDIGKNIIDGIIKGIKNGVGALKDAITSAARSALDTAKRVLGIQSPSKAFEDEVGEWTMPGVARGVLNGAPVLVDAVETAVNGALAAGRNLLGAAQAAPVAAAPSSVVQNFNLTANYARYEEESSLRDTVRSLQLLGARY